MRSPGYRKCPRGGAQHHRGHFLLIVVRMPQCLIRQQAAPANLNPGRIVRWLLSQRGHILPVSLTTATKLPPVGPNTSWNLSRGSITAWPQSLWVDSRVQSALATACSTSASLWCLLTCWESLTCWDSPARGRRGSAPSRTPAKVRTWRPLSLRE